MKFNFTADYQSSTPTDLFTHVGELNYVAPGVLAWMINTAVREVRPSVLYEGVLDVGCSFGTNSMVLSCGLTLREIYAAAEAGVFDLPEPAGLFEKAADSYVVGHDVARNALTFAERAGLVDRVICGDLERRALQDDEKATLAGVRLMISTGVIGYASHRTFQELLGSGDAKFAYGMATCAEWYSLDKIVGALHSDGYSALPLPELVFPQRRVADDAERDWIAGIRSRSGRTSPPGDGWLTCYPFLFADRRSAVEDLAAALRSEYRSLAAATPAEIAAELLDARVPNRVKT
jgi:hypothetical protein